MIKRKKNKRYLFIFLAFTGVFAFCGRKSCSERFVQSRFDEFVFLYDINCVDLNERPLADTLFFLPVFFPRDSSKQVFFISDGKCSACIANLISFLKDYSYSNQRDSVHLTIFLQATSSDLFDYYFDKSKEMFCPSFDLSRNNLHIKVESIDSPARNGAFFIVNKHVVRYDSWNMVY